MFERFTEKGIKVIVLAQEEARRLGHSVVGTEQILLGLVGEGTGIAAKVLRSLGVSLKDARIEVEAIIGRGNGKIPTDIPFSPKTKAVLDETLIVSKNLGSQGIGPGHLLLAMLNIDSCTGVRILEKMGLSVEVVKQRLMEQIARVPTELDQAKELLEQLFVRFKGDILALTPTELLTTEGQRHQQLCLQVKKFLTKGAA